MPIMGLTPPPVLPVGPHVPIVPIGETGELGEDDLSFVVFEKRDFARSNESKKAGVLANAGCEEEQELSARGSGTTGPNRGSGESGGVRVKRLLDTPTSAAAGPR